VHENLFDVIIVNYANADMVGHTGDFNATTQAVETLDQCIKQLRKIIDQHQGTLIITADHGNADCMYNSEKQHVHTAHTKNPVPFIIYQPGQHYTLIHDGNLSNIAPTVLSLLDLPIPPEMTATSLITSKL
jgi:2,3-bisphosphoglycerate-independent phosphoglycerate mutase